MIIIKTRWGDYYILRWISSFGLGRGGFFFILILWAVLSCPEERFFFFPFPLGLILTIRDLSLWGTGIGGGTGLEMYQVSLTHFKVFRGLMSRSSLCINLRVPPPPGGWAGLGVYSFILFPSFSSRIRIDTLVVNGPRTTGGTFSYYLSLVDKTVRNKTLHESPYTSREKGGGSITSPTSSSSIYFLKQPYRYCCTVSVLFYISPPGQSPSLKTKPISYAYSMR